MLMGTQNREFLNKGCVGNNVPNLQNLMIQLRKVCNHPLLINGVEENHFSQYPIGSDEYYNLLIKSSGKLVLLDKLLPKLREDGHKVLIFSQLKTVTKSLSTSMTGTIYDCRDFRLESVK